MDRTFTRSTRRRRRTLDGQWEFVRDPDDVGEAEEYPVSFPSEDADPVPVPCSWNALPDHGDYVGPAWYRRTVDLPASTSIVLQFHGVGHDATVYFDGEEVLSHTGGYTPFSTYVRDVDAGSHDLVVRADNTPADSALVHEGTDWFPHGGIYREVIVEEISDVWVSGIDLDYELDGDEATVDATVTAHNVSPTPSDAQVALSVGESSAAKAVQVPGLNAKLLDFELTVEDVDRWSPADPTLYDVVAAVKGDPGSGGDDLRERIGFRDVAVDGRDVLLNGDPVEIRGVNYREDHPDWGHALPLRVQSGDVDAIREAGFNAVRCADYPPHPRFLDRCDEVGLLVVEGITPHGANEELVEAVHESAERRDAPESVDEDATPEVVLEDGTAIEYESDGRETPPEPPDPTGEARRILTEMVRRDSDHPSVVAWHLGTEGSAGGGGIAETVSQLRESLLGVDDSRLVTAASSADLADERTSVFESSDVLCVNAGPYDEPWDEKFDRIAERYDEKPVMVTDFGSPAVPGERSLSRRSGSESAQAEDVADDVETFRDRDEVSGFAVTAFADSLADDGRLPPSGRVAYTGVCSEYRQPKEAYATLRRLLADE